MIDWKKIISTVCPHARPEILAMFGNADVVFSTWKINTSIRQAHLLGHIAVESAGFTTVEENLNYSAARLLQVWPTHFTNAQARECAHNPRAIAIRAYGGRMGNAPPPSEDGWTFRGKGLLQDTGRANITRLATFMHITPERCAEWQTSADHALDCACAMFSMLGCLPFADTGTVHSVIVAETRHINGGENGLADREASIRRFAELIH